MPHSLSAHLYADESVCVENLLKELPWDANRRERVRKQASDLVTRIRSTKRKAGELEAFLQRYSLDTEEGLALMTLAEALLRIPDAATADALIRDKVALIEWFGKQGGETGDILVKAAGFGLSLTKKTLDSALSKIGGPVIRKAMTEAMRMMGRRFVLGRTIEEAIKNAQPYEKRGYRLSYDMLGEGARTAEDAERYFNTYHHAVGAIAAVNAGATQRPGISVKLSALHPRYEYRQRERCVPEMTERLRALALEAANANIALTVDAEEVDRLELSLQIIESVAADKSLSGWEGFGLAVQAYQKRCRALIDRVTDIAQTHKRRMQVRLVKGAYWDTEIKRAQVLGLPDYPLFTRKANTDVSYIACARTLLERRDILYPMLATHNAHTVAAVIELAGNNRNGFEFQCLHAMAETLHDLVLEEKLAPTCIYAPVGSHEDLLPYLVRRLLENGANSSFLNKMLSKDTPVDEIVADPVEDARAHRTKRHGKIPLPSAIFAGRENSSGMDLTEESVVGPLLKEIRKVDAKRYEAAPLIAGKAHKQGEGRTVESPADKGRIVGQVWECDEKLIDLAFRTAKAGFEKWSAMPAVERAAALEKFAALMERDREELMGLCVREGGKTIDDALAEIREAVDFCRYYAMRGRADFDENGMLLPGPTGERNVLTMHGRGVFVCVSPWNFPLAIFTGQVTAALMAGNAVIAKPASLTPLIAAHAVKLMIEAGVLPEAITLLPGSGKMGGAMVAHPDVAGVAFTGSTEVAWQINRALAAKDGPIVPLIAETGGQNAMIVDSSALTEQVIDDVIISAFTSAGQRCSALRVLFVQDDVADKTIAMLKGAMVQRRIGEPMDLSSDIGPVIGSLPRHELNDHRAWLDTHGGRMIAQMALGDSLWENGYFFAPVAYEISSIKMLKCEVFGPVLHVVRYKSEELDGVVADINDTGFGLTFGLHTRIGSRMQEIARNVRAGNAYINRTMIGAVVGAQPFGGQGLSGTGPKAGGPHYLPRFATERVTSTDTTRQGGNATLVSLKE